MLDKKMSLVINFQSLFREEVTGDEGQEKGGGHSPSLKRRCHVLFQPKYF